MKHRYIADLLGNSESSYMASARIGRWLSALTGLPWLRAGGKDDTPPARIELLVIPNAHKLMIKHVPYWETAVRAAEHVVWLQNDYTIWCPQPDSIGQSLFTCAFTDRNTRGDPAHVWTTCPTRVRLGAYANWNALAYDHALVPAPAHKIRANRARAALYYGAFREGRARDFARYMACTDLVVAPATPNAAERFTALGGEAKVLPARSATLPQLLHAYTHGVYLEDTMSRKQYHSPANRMYEMLAGGQHVLVDAWAAPMLRAQGEFPIADVDIVGGPEALASAVRAPRRPQIALHETAERHLVTLRAKAAQLGTASVAALRKLSELRG